jgi:hypothetical protein
MDDILEAVRAIERLHDIDGVCFHRARGIGGDPVMRCP